MFVHGKFRSSATSIVQAAESMQSGVEGGCSSTKTESAVGKIERSLRSLLGKVAKHSDFEDAQLFLFFKENLPDLEGQIRDLEADHSETNLGNDALDRIRNLRSAPTTAGAVSGGADVASAQAVVVALKAYAESLEIHLEREERVLVPRWLNLSAEMYAKYRTYLVGKYRLVY
ncbi:hypothetical protein Esi_0105_0060 [Ectocarpus siliculosus]|uniref:Hemerythrin-like domain-containing protein n=1 Tax=Ectocarpus siliculosus TaxID=2880 RepID=D7FH67_ECTSI|nr:hypothetical protein Esi_0105_0060 [Ectocarpus siliculosus]|eukprot:CBJ28442.1 hypothetical protein Esi_0105_0060 [Ectocarpus siliculosus]